MYRIFRTPKDFVTILSEISFFLDLFDTKIDIARGTLMEVVLKVTFLELFGEPRRGNFWNLEANFECSLHVWAISGLKKCIS